MAQLQHMPPAPKPPFALPTPADLKLRIPRLLKSVGGAQAAGPAPSPALTSLLSGLVGVPQQTALLGVCEDGLPVLLDLGDPGPGALLVACDESAERVSVLHTLLHSAAALNSPRRVQFLVLSSQPETWEGWREGLAASRHCLGVEALDGSGCERWLLKLSAWADQRRLGSTDGPAVLLVVDDLSAATRMEYDARVNFDWLIKEGPAVKIWPVATAAAESLPGLGRWVRLFRSRALGHTLDPEVYRSAAPLEGDDEQSMFRQPGHFAVHINGSWLRFHTPE